MMLRVNQKNGDLSLTPSALAGAAVMVFSFGAWMTDISIKLAGLGELQYKVAKIEQILTYNHIDIVQADPWPALPREPFYPALPALPSVVAEITKRESASVTLP